MDTPLVHVGAGLVLGTFLCFGSGCSRADYRKRADREVASAIAAKQDALSLDGARVGGAMDAGPESRFFEAFDPDHPPMPPDDPVSHGEMLKAGVRAWRKPGEEQAVQSSVWRSLLPQDRDGQLVLSLSRAVRLGALNSRDFQNEREDLYLSALDLTVERFDFSPKLALGSGGDYRVDGKLKGSRPGVGGNPREQQHTSVLTDGSVRWMAATGGELVVRLANSLVWDFKGGSTKHTAGSLLNFSLAQPLMRLGGRAYTLEALTQSERNLLANVRQMEQYQQGFVLKLTAGRSAGEGPSRRGAVGASGLGVLAGSPSGRTGAPRADGYLGLLEDQQRIRNLEANVARLRESLDQLAAAFDAGRISSRLQVDQARQALFNGQSNLLSSRAAYQSRLDSYKIELGLPPDLPLVVRDPLLAQWIPSDPSATELDRRLEVVEDVLRRPDLFTERGQVRAQLVRLRELEKPFLELLRVAQADLVNLRKALPVRHQQLERLKRGVVAQQLSVEMERFEPRTLDAKVKNLGERMAAQEKELGRLSGDLQTFAGELESLEVEPARARLSAMASELSGMLLSLSLDQTAARLEAATLPLVDLEAKPALAIARENRLDWMNARARLVDAWRKVDYSANPLRPGLGLLVAGNMGTFGNKSARFDARSGTLSGGLRFDSPLNRLEERNAYRAALVDYQRSRREFMLFEDRVSQSLRNTLRIAEISELNFELRRSAVQVAISQVDLARLRLGEPPRPGAQAQIGATTARDLVSALNDLLEAQNDFLSLQVGYSVLRMVLDFELGTLRLDSDGLWSDPGPINATTLAARRPRWREQESVVPPAVAPPIAAGPRRASMR